MNTVKSSSFWASMTVFRNLIMLAAQNETEVAAICKAGNIAVADLNDAHSTVSLETNIAVMEAMLQISGDQDMGLHLGEKSTPPIIGQAGYLQLSSSDVLSAFRSAIYFTRTFTALYDFAIDEKGDHVLLYFEPVQVWNDISPETARHGVDIPFAATVNFMKVLSGQVIYPVKVQYRYPKVADVREHERIFNCTPLFNQQANCISFKKAELQIPVLGYNPQLNMVIEKLLHESLSQSKNQQHFSGKVKEAIINNYPFDFPQLENIAITLNLTPRTLQRKLQEENTSFRELEEEMKKEISLTLLSNPEVSIKEIAYKLGYNDRSSFERAFKQWHGKTPAEYRQ